MISSIHATDGKVLTGLTAEEIGRAVKSADGLVWIDISEDGQTAMDLLEHTLQFHHLAIEDCFDDRISAAKADDYGDYLFLISQGVSYDPETQALEVREAGLFLGRNYVVSVHKQPMEPLQDLLDRAAANSHILERGADFLTHSILDAIVDQHRPVVEAMDERLDQLQAAILEQPHHGHLTSVMALKRDTLRMRRLLMSQADLVNRVSRGEYPQFIRPDTAIFFRDVYDHLVREESLLESVRELSDSALNYYLSATNNRMNEVMKALSVVAAVFLPLTLIASIFGTNLDYSPWGLEFDAGFFLMLAVMVVIAAAMIAYFRSRHWF